MLSFIIIFLFSYFKTTNNSIMRFGRFHLIYQFKGCFFFFFSLFENRFLLILKQGLLINILLKLIQMRKHMHGRHNIMCDIHNKNIVKCFTPLFGPTSNDVETWDFELNYIYKYIYIFNFHNIFESIYISCTTKSRIDFHII